MSDQNKNTNQPSGTKKDIKKASEKKKKFYDVSFFHAWCKTCGLCVEFCPKKIIKADKIGKPEIKDADSCNGCRFCEIHCPDFAITVDLRMPKRRKTDG